MSNMHLHRPTLVVEPPRGITSPVDVRPVTPAAAGGLALERPDELGRTFMSEVSGLAAVGGSAWAISDEYGELVRYDTLGRPGRFVPGLARRDKRPDLESILRLPALDGAVGGATLLALGSGSKHGSRERGIVQSVDAAGRPVGAARELDLAPLYAELGSRLHLQLNIEGAAWRDGKAGAELLLFHRGKLDDDTSTIFRLDGAAVLTALRAGKALPASAVREHVGIDLGRMGGFRLGFSDARALPDGSIAFVASAEGNDAVGDGVLAGAVVGMLDADLRVTALRPLTGPLRKVEGIEIARELDPSAPANRFVVVTDADDPKRAAEVLHVDL
jgi:hypothetical protein